MKNFEQIYTHSIKGAISGWDRIRFRGTIRWLANTSGMNSYLGSRHILLKDFGKWAESVTKQVRSICAARAKELAIPLIYLVSASIDKEAQARKIMTERKILTGDICMFSTVEPCMAPDVRGNRKTKLLELQMRPRRGRVVREGHCPQCLEARPA